MSSTNTPDSGGKEIQADQTSQPPGLWVLFITEMWERFSYYGMRALFVLFLIASANKFLPVDPASDAGKKVQSEVVSIVAAAVGVPKDQIKLDAKLDSVGLDDAGLAKVIADVATKYGAEIPAGGELSVQDLVTAASATVQGESNENPGFGWKKNDAYTLYGIYTFMAYFTSIFGGIVADRYLGTHRSMLLGGVIIVFGHIALAGMAFFPYELGQTVSEGHGYGALLCFLVGCSLIIIGTGLFKPCVSVMVGQLYRENDPRRDSGFTFFYMGINLGAFFAPLVAGSLGEKIGWHWGFGSAAVGMVVGLVGYQFARARFLGTVGSPPDHQITRKDKALVALAFATLIGTPIVPL